MLSELWRPVLVLVAFLAIMVVILILLFAGGDDDEPYVTPEVTTPTATLSPGELDVEPKQKSPDAESVPGKDLKVGDCLVNATAVIDVVKTFDKIDCDKRHDAEVFTIIKLKGDRFPGTKFVSGKGQRGCRARLRRQATTAEFANPRLGFKFVYPTRQSWEQDDREVTCLATFKRPRRTKLDQR